MLPPEVLGDLVRLPLRPPMTAGPSGRREYGNEQRVYFDRTNMGQTGSAATASRIRRCLARLLATGWREP